MGRTRDVSKILNSNTPLTSTYLTLASASSTYATQTNFSATGWTTFDPTIKQGATTLTKTVSYARYKQIGKVVFLQINVTINSTGATNGIIIIDPPAGLTPINMANEPVLGTIYIRDTGTAFYGGFVTSNGSSFIARSYGSGDSMGANTPAFTLVNNDTVSIQVTYEVA